MYTFKGNNTGDGFSVDIIYNGVTINTKNYSSTYSSNVDGVQYSGLDAAINSSKYEAENFGFSINGKIYPSGADDRASSNTITNVTTLDPNTTTDTTFSTNPNITNPSDALNAAKDTISEKIVSLQSIGLPPITDIPKILWEQVIKPQLLTERQVAKKMILLSTKTFPVPMTEEDAQLFIYGKIYYKDGSLYDNDAKDPNCVAQPGDEDYQPPIDKTHPIWQKIEKYIKDFKDSLIQLGIKLGEFLFLIPATIANITIGLTSLLASIVILPFGSGIPTAMNAILSMMNSIKILQAKFAEILPLLAGIAIIGLLLPPSAQDIISKITALLATMGGILVAMTSILGLMDTITKLVDKSKKKMKSVKFSVKAKADPTSVKLNQSTILTVEASGGDYDYVYEWTDSNGAVISNSTTSGDDDGKREITPIIPTISAEQLKKGASPTIEYICKVTDNGGKGTSSTGSVTITRI